MTTSAQAHEASAAPGASCSNAARGCRVLEDVAKGWEGFCMGLDLFNQSTTQDACRAACCSNPACEVWQWATKRTDRNPASSLYKSCYTGKGFECRSVRTDDFLVYAGQRVSHGTKLGDGVWCTGNGMRKQHYSSRISHKDRMDSCRSTCFFDKDCHVWQYSTLKGCWSGWDSHGSIQCSLDVSLKGSIMDAQRFDRSCEAIGKLKTNYVQVFLVIISAALLLVFFASCVIFFDFCKPRRQSSSRTPRGSKSSRRQKYDDDFLPSMNELDIMGLQYDNSRPVAAQGGLYRPIQSLSGSATPSEGSMSAPNSMSVLMPTSSGLPGLSAPRPTDASFGAVSGVSSNSSFGQGTSLLLPPQYRQQQVMPQPGAPGYVGAPMGYPSGPVR